VFCIDVLHMFICRQVSDTVPDIVSSLESHPHIRHVTPHKKVTRTLKLVKRENVTVLRLLA